MDQIHHHRLPVLVKNNRPHHSLKIQRNLKNDSCRKEKSLHPQPSFPQAEAGFHIPTILRKKLFYYFNFSYDSDYIGWMALSVSMTVMFKKKILKDFFMDAIFCCPSTQSSVAKPI
ncbi:unnamed protein product [Schistosoma intercalatum]|nr:unnamed protein product [Schistosoma intercalatum]